MSAILNLENKRLGAPCRQTQASVIAPVPADAEPAKDVSLSRNTRRTNEPREIAWIHRNR
jgi:hypothetical protein